MNKRYLIMLVAGCISSLLVADEVVQRVIKSKPPSRLKEVKPSIEKVDLVGTATTTQLKQSAPSKKKPWFRKWTINKIVRRVNGINILQSDLERPRISKEGGRYDLDELTTEELLIQKAGELHMLPTPADIDRQLIAFKIQNNLTGMGDDEFEEQLKESGFNLLEYKTQLGRLIATENVRRVELSERLVITSQEVEKFYHENPAYLPEAYHLNICTIPTIREYQKYLQSSDASWHDLGIIEKDEIGSHFSFVTSLKPGQLSKPFKMDGQYKVIKLITKQEYRLKTLDERYIDIERELQEKKRGQYLKQLEREIKKNATIVDLK